MSGAGVKSKMNVGGGAPPLASSPEGPRRTPPNGGHPRNAPEEIQTPWSWVSLAEAATIERNAIQPEEIESGTAYLGLENIQSGGAILGAKYVAEGNLESTKFRFSSSHLLYGKLRPYLAKIACPDFDGICSTDILPILPGPKLDRKFLCYYLRQPSVVEYANSLASGANLPRLSPSSLEKFLIPLPPLPEQRRIAEVLDRADRLRIQRLETLTLLDKFIHSIFVTAQGEMAEIGVTPAIAC